MDCTTLHNQIQMALADQEDIVFRTPKVIPCYRVMPFGLKDAGATYQRVLQMIFEDMLHRNLNTMWMILWFSLQRN